jgi:hypothetical protein
MDALPHPIDGLAEKLAVYALSRWVDLWKHAAGAVTANYIKKDIQDFTPQPLALTTSCFGPQMKALSKRIMVAQWSQSVIQTMSEKKRS